MFNRIFSAIILAVFAIKLSGCASAIIAGGAAAIGASSSEKGFATSINDTSISLKIRDKFVQTDIDLVEGISIQVDEGNVLLVGRIENQELKVKASKLAWEVRGVREVVNELQVTDSSSIKDIAKDLAASATLRTKLIADSGISSLNFNLDVVNGTIYLSGVAANADEMNRVVAHARDVRFTQQVVNYIILQTDKRL